MTADIVRSLDASLAPDLTVVMPTFNQRRFIEDALQSVVAQKQELGGRMEIIVVDGASTDGTLAVLERWATRFPGVFRYLSEPDHGPAEAVNKAVAMARAPTVGWLNSDDLYCPGAAARACGALASHREWVMVYGEADHVDEDGAVMGRYPTQRPDRQLLSWADGCPICQPSAFFRRDAWAELGGLDTSLRAAFDFDFWLRLFARWPGRVGFVDAVQARSRLHAGAITMRQRERVAMEGMQVVARHLGRAPVHWLLTHADEVLALHPFHPASDDLRTHLLGLAERAAGWIGPQGVAEFAHRLDDHRALQLATAGFGIGIHPDGWAPQVCDLRLRQGPEAIGLVRLHARHASPAGGPLAGTIATPEEGVLRFNVPRPGPFTLEIPVAPAAAGARLVIRIGTDRAFVPSEVDARSDDARRLAFLVEGIELVPARG